MAFRRISELLAKDRIVAPPGFNRWKVPPASIAIHLCIGSVYAWSIYNPFLVRQLGVVAPAADDWSLRSVVAIFSVAIVFLGLSAAVAGKWLEEVGPRMVGVVAAFLWGGGYLIGGVGILFHQLWLLYLGYGVLGGCGLGLGYVSPVSTLIRWFPDRRGMATGLAIMGFGGGAMVATPMKEGLLAFFSKAPQYLGPEATVGLVTENGHRFANLGGRMVEVVVAGAQQLKDVPFKADPGVYVVGTGNTGASATFFTLGVLYFCVMMLAALSFRTPAEGWAPTGWSPVKQQAKKFVTAANVHIDQALKTPQFWLMWLALCLNVTAGIAVIGIARTMMTEIFGTPLPDVVTPAFAATYVLMISLFNMLGRFFWASASDYIGRKTTFFIFFTLGTLLYLLVPSFAIAGSTSTSVFWLFAFYAATMIIFTMYGGGFSTIPAYLADIFGTRYVGGIHGRILTAWSTAGVVGPLLLTSLRQHSLGVALHKLASMVDPAVFQMKFGAPLAQLDQLIAANTVTVASLMEIVPAGTPNPTPFLYNSTMYTMVALLVVAFFCNWAIKPVARRHLMREPAGAQAEAT